MSYDLELVAHCNNFSGWGLETFAVAKALTAGGINFFLNPFAWDFRDLSKGSNEPDPIKMFLESKLDPHYKKPTRRLVCVSPVASNTFQLVKDSILYTFWESSNLPSRVSQRLNECKAIIVCSEWNIHSFSASGIDVSLFRVSRGVNRDIYKYTDPNLESDFTFLTGGRKEGGGYRKNIDQVIRAFTKLNSKYTKTKLVIKSFPDESIQTRHPKVSVLNKLLTTEEMADFYSKGNVFVSASSSEGWGLMPFEAMACGRPAIMARFSGVTQYFDSYVGYCVDYDLVKTTGIYSQVDQNSIWAQLDDSSLYTQMERAYINKSEYLEKCKRCDKRMNLFTEDFFNENLCKAVRKAML